MNAPIALSRQEKAQRAIAEQRRWIAEHGGDEAGYIRRYGDSNADYGKPVSAGGRYGAGGQVIYAADLAELDNRVAALAALPPEKPGQRLRVPLSLEIEVDRDDYILNYGSTDREEIGEYARAVARDAVETALTRLGWAKVKP